MVSTRPRISWKACSKAGVLMVSEMLRTSLRWLSAEGTAVLPVLLAALFIKATPLSALLPTMS